MKKSFNLADLDTMTSLIDAIFSEMNVGLIVYQVENWNARDSLKLVYANKQASKYIGSDLRQMLGKYILEAFPALRQTDIPEQYLEVAQTKQSRTIGAFEYGDVNVGKNYYALKAFPMPNDCVGVLFENITMRKQMEEMIKQYSEQVRDKNVNA